MWITSIIRSGSQGKYLIVVNVGERIGEQRCHQDTECQKAAGPAELQIYAELVSSKSNGGFDGNIRGTKALSFRLSFTSHMLLSKVQADV